MVNYSYYTATYLGDVNTIPENVFNKLERKAVNNLKRYTFNRIKEDTATEQIKLCVCEMVECIYQNLDRDGIVSVNTDGYSETYDKSVSMDTKL